MNKPLPSARLDNIVIQEVEDETLVYDVSSHKAFCLNKTAAAVWKRCDGKTNLTLMTKLVSDDLKTEVEPAVVQLAISDLRNQQLLCVESSLPEIPDLDSRREFVRKAGLTAAVILPVVASIAAPNAANAQSMNCNQVMIGFQCAPICRGLSCAGGMGTCGGRSNLCG